MSRVAYATDLGASAVEYALLIFAIAAAVVIAAVGLGGVVNELFTDSATCIENHNSSSC